MTIGQIGDNLVYANPGGHGILEELEQIKRKMDILMAKDEKRLARSTSIRKRSHLWKVVSDIWFKAQKVIYRFEGDF